MQGLGSVRWTLTGLVCSSEHVESPRTFYTCLELQCLPRNDPGPPFNLLIRQARNSRVHSGLSVSGVALLIRLTRPLQILKAGGVRVGSESGPATGSGRFVSRPKSAEGHGQGPRRGERALGSQQNERRPLALGSDEGSSRLRAGSASVISSCQWRRLGDRQSRIGDLTE